MKLETPIREQQEGLGARIGVWFGTMLASNYGDFEREYQHARQAAAVVDTNFRLVAELTGPDRVRYLNAITSGNIQGLAEGQSALGLLLNPQGHILAELRTLDLGEKLLMLSHVMTGERTLATLDKFIIMDDVTLTDQTPKWASVSVVGPAAGKVMESATGMRLDALDDGAHVEVKAGDVVCRIVHATALGLEGAEVLVERGRAGELWQRLADATVKEGGGAAGYDAINALRLEAGAPWFRADFDDRVIPHEAGLETSHVSYVKGCYTGQEIVERVRSRGQVNRRLAGLAFGEGELPEPGAKLLVDGKEVGWVTSAAQSPSAHRPIGLGYLRREFREVGTRVRWDGGEVEVIRLPIG